MPAAPSSLTDPAIGQLLSAAQALGSDRGRLLPVLAGARSFTAIAEWAADADQATQDALGITGVVPCESTFRRTLQHLDADALDDAAGAWAQGPAAHRPGARRAAGDRRPGLPCCERAGNVLVLARPSPVSRR